MKVSIIGTGYVGLTTGVCLAWLGHEVTCVDTDQAKVDSLSRSIPTIYEPFLEQFMAEARDRIRFTTSYAEAIPGCEVIFIAVGTPPGPGGSPDLRYLAAAAKAVGQNFDGEYAVVVNKSTVPIGSGNWVDALLCESFQESHGSAARGPFSVASNPEFLREGTAIHDTLYADRVVIGSDSSHSLEVLYTLYRPILDQTFMPPSYLPRPEDLGAVPLVSTDLASAELIKYAANAFLALKISYINEIGQLAEKVGADITQVAKGIGLDARIGSRFLQAGLGWGGSCFGKDTAALVSTASEYGLKMHIVEAARAVNTRQRERVVEKLLAELKILKGRSIALLGLAFKPNTDDLREAPAIAIAEQLVDRGCKVRVHDPVALDRFRREHAGLGPRGVICCDTPEHTVEGADAVVLVTEWPQYRDLDWEAVASAMRTRLVLDGRNVLDRARLTRAGLHVLTMSGDSQAAVETTVA